MTKFILTITLTLLSTIAPAQLKGSGKTITKSYDYQNFDKIDFDDLDGKLEVEIGKPFSIAVTIDDNLLPLLSFDENQSDQSLSIFFKGNNNNKMYIEDTNVKIKITMPSATEIHHAGNSSLNVTNIDGSTFKLDNADNASTTLSGAIDQLEIKNHGNGIVNATKLIAEKATIKSSGNGNVTANVSDTITGKAVGNGSIYNKGKAKFDANSSKSGNGHLINL